MIVNLISWVISTHVGTKKEKSCCYVACPFQFQMN